tara:strand:+ start:1387 stop:3036 length:1650 start_codon:yes stop_codon:yes gene_type:complete
MLKKLLKSPKAKLITALVILITGSVVIGFSLLKNNSSLNTNKFDEQINKTVQILNLAQNDLNNNIIKIIGQVIPESQIDVISLAQGNLQSLNFEIGKNISSGQILAQLYNQTIFTNFTNAQINFNNMQASFISSQSLADQVLRQAELGLAKAKESTRSAEINFESTKNSSDLALGNLYDNIPNILNDTYSKAYYSVNTLTDLMFANDQTTHPKLSFLVSDFQIQIDTEWQRILAGKALIKLEENIKALSLEQAEEQIIIIRDFLMRLDNALNASIDLSQTILDSYKFNNSTGLANINNSLTIINAQEQAIETQKVLNENNISTVESRLDLAKISEQNAQASIDSAKQSKEQQIISAQIGLDNARAQKNLVQAQVNDLTIKAPISGQVTAKYIEFGQEINPGQAIAQISNNDSLKIKASLPAEDAKFLYLGQETNLGIISLINPAADPISKKQDIEIISNNLYLISGTFVDVEILTNNNSGKILIPLNAVHIAQDESFVFILENNKAIKRRIILGQSKNNLIEIISGLEIDDEIILNKDVAEGELVEIIR